MLSLMRCGIGTSTDFDSWRGLGGHARIAPARTLARVGDGSMARAPKVGFKVLIARYDCG